MENLEVEATSENKLFEHSPEIVEIIKAVSAFQTKCPLIVKDKLNPHLRSKYADLGNILQTINPLLGECGLAVFQMPVGDSGDLITLITHTSGQWLRFCYRMKPMDNKPQSIGSTLTYQKRYALTAALLLPVDDDDDGEAGSKKPKSKIELLKSDLSTLMRATKSKDEIFAKAGLCPAKEMGDKDEAYLRKAYEALGGDKRLTEIRS